MKLFSLFKRYLVVVLLAVMLLGSVAHFFIFRFFIHRSANGVLYEYKHRIQEYVALHDTLIVSSMSDLQPLRVEARSVAGLAPDTEYIIDTLLYNEHTGEFAPYRQLYFVATFQGNSYLINVNQATMETQDMLYAVLASLGLLVLLLMLFSYLTGRYVQHKLWRPFYHLLAEVQAYDLRQSEVLQLYTSGIVEFDELNRVLGRMVQKMHQNYLSLKVFAEDASHEMQTPLSVIKSKLDLIMQGQMTEENYSHAMEAMLASISRISRLNKSLLLLVKIGNNQFEDTETLNLASVVRSYVDDMCELIEARGLSLVIHENSGMWVVINRTLAEVLVSNLLSNAIRYNVEGGRIEVVVSETELQIGNTSQALETTADLTARFVRSAGGNTTGLGLNIVKSICEAHQLVLQYDYKEGWFSISVSKVA